MTRSHSFMGPIYFGGYCLKFANTLAFPTGIFGPVDSLARRF